MKQIKRIKDIIPSSKVNMGGVILDQPLPNPKMDMADPFLLIHHWNEMLEGGKLQQNSGVGPHPHRGFSPVTLVFKGGIHHRDSRGNDSIVYEGGVQWMEAGMGIIHSERPVKKLAEKGGPFEIIQFWLNLPADNKMGQPRYIPLQKEDIPVKSSKDGKAEVAVIAGEFNGVKGPVDHPSAVTICRIDMDPNATVEFELPANYETLLYILDGQLQINNERGAGDKSLVRFENDGQLINLESKATTRAILLSGLPLNESVTSYGPFVMNDQTQIMEAMRDAQQGKMGVLIEDFS